LWHLLKLIIFSAYIRALTFVVAFVNWTNDAVRSLDTCLVGLYLICLPWTIASYLVNSLHISVCLLWLTRRSKPWGSVLVGAMSRQCCEFVTFSLQVLFCLLLLQMLEWYALYSAAGVTIFTANMSF